LSGSLRLVVLGVLAALVVGMWALAFVSKRMERVAAGIAPLEERVFDDLTLIPLGTGGSFENPARLGPAVAVGAGRTVLLVDAGRGVAEALRAAGIPVDQPAAVLFTSLLPENTVGLDDLWLTGWLGPRRTPLGVLGPEGTAALVEGLARAHRETRGVQGEIWELPPEGGRLVGEEPTPGETLRLDELVVRPEPLAGAPLPTFAWRIETPTRAVVVAGGGADPERLAALASGADALVVGAVYGASLEAASAAGAERIEVLEREAGGHLRLEDVGTVASRAGVRTLVLTRLRPPPIFDLQNERVVAETFRGRVVVAQDGEPIALGSPRPPEPPAS